MIRKMYECISCEITRIRARAIAVYYVELRTMNTIQRRKMISFDPADKGRR